MPASYLQLLSIYDGIDNFEWVDVSLLSTDYLLTYDDLDRDWVEAGALPADGAFVFAQSDSDTHIVAFLTRKVGADGEMAIVHLDAEGPLGEHKNLEEYLLAHRDWFAGELAQAESRPGRAIRR